MALIAPRVAGALPAEDAQRLQHALEGGTDITVFVDGTVHRLPPQARDAVVDLLARFSRGEAVTVSSVEDMLTTSQAAELAGISHTYLRNMTDRGEIPVEYRGTHRRIRLAAIMAWLEGQKKKQAAERDDHLPDDEPDSDTRKNRGAGQNSDIGHNRGAGQK
jgi:excisionase family DNA binding protein